MKIKYTKIFTDKNKSRKVDLDLNHNIEED